MKNDKKASALDKFLGKKAKNTAKSKIIDEREGLIERVDKVLITKDGKQLLREQY